MMVLSCTRVIWEALVSLSNRNRLIICVNFFFNAKNAGPEISAGHRILTGAKLPLTSSTLLSARHIVTVVLIYVVFEYLSFIGIFSFV